jgi:hypothetical protein
VTVSSLVWVNSPSWEWKRPWRIAPRSARIVRQVWPVRISATQTMTSARKQISTCARIRSPLEWKTGRSRIMPLRSRKERSASSSRLYPSATSSADGEGSEVVSRYLPSSLACAAIFEGLLTFPVGISPG